MNTDSSSETERKRGSPSVSASRINPLDAIINALVSRDCFATVTASSSVQDSLKEMEPSRRAYLDEGEHEAK